MPTPPRLSFGAFFLAQNINRKINVTSSRPLTLHTRFFESIVILPDNIVCYLGFFFLASGYCRRMHKPTRVYCPKIPYTNRYCRTIRLCTSMNKCFCFFFWGFTNIFKRLYRAQNWHSFRERLIVVLYYYQQSSV